MFQKIVLEVFILKLNMKSGIYYIKCLKNNKIYIGSAININYRFKRHIKSLTNNKHHSIRLQRAWNKYGKNEFEFGIIEKVVYDEFILDLETKYIENYRSSEPKYGFNIYKDARSRLGFKHSNKTKKLISENSYSKGKLYENAVRPSTKTYQYDIYGNFIKEWLCVKKASDELNLRNSNIFKCMNGERILCGGFRWYRTHVGDKIDSIYVSTVIIQFDLDGNLIKKYDNIDILINENPNYNKKCIRNVCNNIHKRCYGYVWKYEKNIKNEQ